MILSMQALDLPAGFPQCAATEEPDGGGAVERSEIPDHYKWNLERVYVNWEAWEKDFSEIESILPKVAGYRDSLGRSPHHLLQAITEILAVRRKLEVVMVFASMKSDEDTRNSENTARRGRSRSLATRFAEAISWFEPEVLGLGAETLAEFTAEEPDLKLYNHFFDNILRSRDHTLSPDQEALLAAAGNMARGAGQVFNALNNADLQFSSIVDEEGRTVELTKARYGKYIKSTERRVRQEAFEALHDSYGDLINTLAANMDANVNNHVFYARARKHPGTLEAALHPNAIPPAVFHNLLRTTEANLPVAHRYTQLKQRILGIIPLRDHDLHVPLFPAAEIKFDYEEARDLLLEAFAPLGDDYLAIVRKGFEGGWIDVHENIGKRSGAYSSGVYDTSPYILMNWSGQLSDTFTLAHELGHSVHTYLATRHQPYVYGDYPIFTAEVASTCNEMLLLDHLLKHAESRERKLFLLDHQLSQINNTVIRQTMLAEFEYRMHRLGEEEQTLTADQLDDLYSEVLAKYWGNGVEFDPQRSPVAWSRIPHFYFNYYVYQYATAFSAAAVFARQLLAGDVAARERYLIMLSSGNSRYPVETLQRAGVDMTQPLPIQKIYELFGQLLDQVVGLLDEGKA